MIQQIENISINKVEFTPPSICPICNHNIEPIYLNNNMFQLNETDNGLLFIFFRCPHCNNCFITSYNVIFLRIDSGGYRRYKQEALISSSPSKFKKQEFEKCINTVSPSFVKIYNQALEAEHYNLDEIAGIGYRKALEFLIKDYCIFKNPLEIDTISKKPLAQCIENYIDDNRLKKTAKASAWLGNDETHYIKKFEDKDINDLKRFINTTVYFILYNMNVDEADEILNSQ